MNILWLLILLAVCFVPTVIYLAVTKQYGGEPALLKAKGRK